MQIVLVVHLSCASSRLERLKRNLCLLLACAEDLSPLEQPTSEYVVTAHQMRAVIEAAPSIHTTKMPMTSEPWRRSGKKRGHRGS